MSAVPLPANRSGTWLAITVAVFAAGAAAILFAFDPAHSTFYPICYTKAFFGINCPGCGSMRAMHQLLHGHFLAAARFNLLLVVYLPQLGWWAARRSMQWLAGQPVNLSVRPMWLWLFLILGTIFTVLRNLPGFEWLAPPSAL